MHYMILDWILVGKKAITKDILFYFIVFLGLHHLRHMEVPRLGIESELYSWQPTPQPQQGQIWAVSATYTAAHSNTQSLTHWGRPGIEPATSWMLDTFLLSHEGKSTKDILTAVGEVGYLELLLLFLDILCKKKKKESLYVWQNKVKCHDVCNLFSFFKK